jgi:branched-chain amino acid aminotransferase
MAFEIIPHANPVSKNDRDALLADPGFGRVFTDHMATIRWAEGKGWHDARIEPRGPFQIDPACAVLHYAQEIFEGMKAYRLEGGGVALFRPDQNAQRFRRSAERLAMPQIPQELFIEAVEALVRTDEAWVPAGEGSLYLRPFMFASEAFLGVRPSNEYIFCVIASPAGRYFKGGKTSVNIWVSEDYSRAAAGGTGAAKCGGNYASSLVAQSEAYAHGCDQVIFLDSSERKWVEELGGMNIFFVFANGSIVTPALGGTILPGITRASIIDLARARGHTVEERRYSIDEWKADVHSGRLREVFACGTAAVITSIGEVRGEHLSLVTSVETNVTDALYAELTGIQAGRLPDTHGWTRRVI